MKQERLPFENRMTPLQIALGWLWFPLYVIVAPLLLNIYGAVNAPNVTIVQINLAYVGIGMAFVLIVMFSFLRRSFDAFADRPGLCLWAMMIGFVVNWGLSLAVSLLLLLFGDVPENPNDAFILDMAGSDFGPVAAMTVFLAPIVEEVLFRGVVFGSVAPRSRGWAYVLSAALFSLNHVWQYAAANADPLLLLYAVRYVPVSLVLAWCYDRSGSIWTPIFFHMGFNALSFLILG